ncbi:tripartite ATP-independent transporter solute receptor, DctP family [Franzmannia pantelleriensis]|uniref:Tripartite ATP-independent transporter solute receptor, DctP family n=1 Tax=Franzmannia pantelleriensis TaxID=48727 RepID=A0A1G9PDC8_9GAMM|nr:TRAP transporter substrate-binding protein [Halomonas pantelleriensis]SDL96806.1 tripartite ATP-independent transporter solute receptor, DctP family [Halomonas pantelleriensis]
MSTLACTPRFTLKQLVAATSLAALATAPAAFADPIEIQINNTLPTGSFAHTFLEEFSERLEDEAPGRFNVRLFMGGTLGTEEDVLQGLGMGTHHASLAASAVTQFNARTSVFDLPYLFENREDVAHFIDSEAGDMLREGFEGTGMRLLAMWDNGFRVITNNQRPIVAPEDLDGLRIRTPNSRQRVAMFNALGANATPLAFGEVYSALDQGVIDGQENPAHVAESARLYEVQDYLSVSNHIYLPTFLVFGEPFLNRLADEDLEVLERVAQAMTAWTFDWGDEADESVLAELEQYLEINEIDFTAFQEAALPLYDDPVFVDAIGQDMIDTTLDVMNAR